MVTPSAGTVILVPFPFSDLTQAKLRPAVVLAQADRGDWILCQITSKLRFIRHIDPIAIPEPKDRLGRRAGAIEGFFPVFTRRGVVTRYFYPR